MNTRLPSTADKLPARDRILLAAYALFYGEGIRATGIDRVIAESGVTKVTFYRHFPSKNDLILAFLEYRHQQWMEWFSDAVMRHGGDVDALVPALAEWFRSENFRGCAFLNSVSELGSAMPEIADITRQHKLDMETVIAGCLPSLSSSRRRRAMAQAMAVGVDGAIVRAQFDHEPDAALQALQLILNSLKQSL